LRLARQLWLLPPVVLGLFLLRFGVDVPIFDQWELVPQLQKLAAGTLTFADLALPQNEHQIFFPRCLMVGMARLSHWNIGWELAATYLFALGIGAVVALRFRRLKIAWALPLASLMIFSFVQKENWLWGWQLQMMLVTTLSLAALALLARAQVSTVEVALASLLGVIATWTFANGVAVFPVGLVVLWCVGRAQPVRVAVLGGVGAVAIGLYVHNYHPIVGHPPATYVLHHPIDGVLYGLAFLGSPLGLFKGVLAAVLGALGLVALGWLWRARWREASREELAFALGLAGFTLAAAAITTVGRAGFGIDQAVSSRYTTLATPMWLALIVLAANSSLRRPLLGVLAVLALGVYVQSGRFALVDSYVRRADRDLLRSDPEQGLLHLYPGDGRSFLRERLQFLRDQHLSLFRQ
jgi:hypothetical protein